MTRPLRPARLGASDILVERRADGCMLLRAPQALGPYPRSLAERLDFWAERAPERIFLAQRAGSGWRTLTFRNAPGTRAPRRASAAALQAVGGKAARHPVGQ